MIICIQKIRQIERDCSGFESLLPNTIWESRSMCSITAKYYLQKWIWFFNWSFCKVVYELHVSWPFAVSAAVKSCECTQRHSPQHSSSGSGLHTHSYRCWLCEQVRDLRGQWQIKTCICDRVKAENVTKHVDSLIWKLHTLKSWYSHTHDTIPKFPRRYTNTHRHTSTAAHSVM